MQALALRSELSSSLCSWDQCKSGLYSTLCPVRALASPCWGGAGAGSVLPAWFTEGAWKDLGQPLF